MRVSDSGEETSAGVITLWYQLEEDYGLKLNISYATRSNDANHITSENSVSSNLYPVGKSVLDFAPPDDVILLTSWWPLQSYQHKGGVLKADRLSCFTSAKSAHKTDQSGKYMLPVPSSLVRSGVGLVPTSHSKEGGFDICWVCGCVCKKSHWLALQEHEDDEDDDADADEDNDDNEFVNQDEYQVPGGSLAFEKEGVEDRDDEKASKGIIQPSSKIYSRAKIKKPTSSERGVSCVRTTKSKKRKVSSNNDSKASKMNNISTCCSTKCSNTLRETSAKLSLVEELLENKKNECRSLLQRFDDRLRCERSARRKWNDDKLNLEKEVSDLRKRNMVLEHDLEEMKQRQTIALAKMNSMFASTGEPMVSSLASSQNSPGHQLTNFCVVCQDNTANNMVLNCGHICLCQDHADIMRHRNSLSVCPVCKKECSGIRRI